MQLGTHEPDSGDKMLGRPKNVGKCAERGLKQLTQKGVHCKPGNRGLIIMLKDSYFDRSYLDLTEEEIKALAKLTPKEQTAVDAFLAAAKALPKSLCIDVRDDAGEPNLKVSKRITRGSCQQVAGLRKKSLVF